MSLAHLAKQFETYMTAAEMMDHPDYANERSFFGLNRAYKPPTLEQRLEAANRTIARQQVLLDERDALRDRVARLKRWNGALAVSLCGALTAALVALPAFLGVL